MPACPICATLVTAQDPGTPYWACPGNCDAWFQSPLPPKVYEAAHEKDAHGDFAGHRMAIATRQSIVRWRRILFARWLDGRPGRTLDIGSKYPYLAHCLRELGCESFGMDNIEIVPEYARSLNVPMLMADFEEISDATHPRVDGDRALPAHHHGACVRAHVRPAAVARQAAAAGRRRWPCVPPPARSSHRRLRARPDARPLHHPPVLPRAGEPARAAGADAGPLHRRVDRGDGRGRTTRRRAAAAVAKARCVRRAHRQE